MEIDTSRIWFLNMDTHLPEPIANVNLLANNLFGYRIGFALMFWIFVNHARYQSINNSVSIDDSLDEDDSIGFIEKMVCRELHSLFRLHFGDCPSHYAHESEKYVIQTIVDF